MTNTSPFELRLTWARSLFDHGDYAAAATALVALVDEARESEMMHGTTELREMLARAYFGSAQLGRAEATLRDLVADEPTDGYAHLLLGRTLQRQSKHDEARQHLALAEVLGDYERPEAYGEAKRDDDASSDDATSGDA